MSAPFLSLGLLFLMFWSLQQAQGALAAALFPWRKKWLWGAGTSGTIALVREQLMAVLLEPSAHANRTQALTAQLLRLRSWRANLMWACFAFLGVTSWLVFSQLFLRVSGLYVLSVGGLLLFAANFARRGREAALTVLFVGLFLFAAEHFLRLNLIPSGDVPPLLQWTTDGRGLAVLGLLIAGLLTGWLVRIEGFAFVLAFAGLASGAMSLSGAVMFWAGERAGLSVALGWTAWRARWPQGARRLAFGVATAAVLGSFIGWWLLGWARDFAMDFGSLGTAQVPMRMDGFLLFSILVELPVIALTLVWGHLAGAKTPDDALESATLARGWFHQGALRTPVLKLLRAGLRGRMDEIDRLRQGFNEAEWEKVPPFVKNASQTERTALAETAKALDADLLSRSEFFGHQWR